MVLQELTVPWEDGMEQAQKRKKTKYADLVAKCWKSGWRASCKHIKVDYRGFAGQSLHWALGVLGIYGMHRQRTIKNITEAAEKAPRWLWLKRGMHDIVPGNILETSRGLITPGWVTRVRVSDVIPETLHDPGYITKDVSRMHHKVYLSTQLGCQCCTQNAH